MEEQPLINREGPVALNEAPNLVLTAIGKKQSADCCAKASVIFTCGLLYSCFWRESVEAEDAEIRKLISLMKNIRRTPDAATQSAAVILQLQTTLQKQGVLSDEYRQPLNAVYQTLIRRETPQAKLKRQAQEPDSSESKQDRYIDNLL